MSLMPEGPVGAAKPAGTVVTGVPRAELRGPAARVAVEDAYRNGLPEGFVVVLEGPALERWAELSSKQIA
jgi:hypothetical protein